MIELKSKPVEAVPKDSLNYFFRQLEYSDVVDSLTDDNLFYWHTEVQHPWFNGVLISRKAEDVESDAIRQIKNFFSKRGVSNYTIWLDRDEWLAGWGKHLEPAGYHLNRFPPGMVADLEKITSSYVVPGGFRIVKVEDPDTLRQWIDVFIPGYGLPESFSESFYKLMASFGTDQQVHSYLGYLNEKPVTVSSLFLNHEIAGIYNVATLAEARGMGLGTAITLKPLLDARDRGYKLGALQSSDMGFRVYERIGFRKVCDVLHFSV